MDSSPKKATQSRGRRLSSTSCTSIVLALALGSRAVQARISSFEEVCTDEKLRRFPGPPGAGGWPKALDVSVYWYGPNDETERATGAASLHYDPAKSTVILIDGWDGWDEVKSCHRMGTWCTTNTSNPNTCKQGTSIARPWIERGWNFGILYWDQFADTPCTTWAEQKIWNTKQDPKMTWNSYDAVTKETVTIPYAGPEASIGELCAQRLRDAMPTLTSGIVQVAGFSLGAQAAAACADHFYKETPEHPAAPRRLTLLDPFFHSFIKGKALKCFGHDPLFKNKFSKHADYKHTTWLTVHAVQRLWQHGVIMELYKGSTLTEHRWWGFNPAHELESLGSLVYWDHRFCGLGPSSMPCRHRACVESYFLLMGNSSPPVETYQGVVGNCYVPGPTCTIPELMAMMNAENELMKRTGKHHVWEQVDGRPTFNLGDDLYRRELVDVRTDVRLPEMTLEYFQERQNSSAAITLQSKAADVPPVPQQLPTQAQSNVLPIFIVGALCCCCCIWAVLIWLACTGSERRHKSTRSLDAALSSPRSRQFDRQGSPDSSIGEFDDDLEVMCHAFPNESVAE